MQKKSLERDCMELVWLCTFYKRQHLQLQLKAVRSRVKKTNSLVPRLM